MLEPLIPGLYELPEPAVRGEVLDRLAAMPGRIAPLVQRAGRDELVRVPSPGEWSAFQVLCHVRDIVMVYGMRFRWMVFDDNPLLPNYDEDRWVEACRDEPGDIDGLLATIATVRGETARMLERLTPEEWERTGRHEVLGTVELEPYVRHQLAHEDLHVAQMAAALQARRPD